MNRFLGLSGVVHLAIFAGIIYFCATYDYSSPYKVDKAELDVKAAFAPATPNEEAPATKEVAIANSNPTAKLNKAAKEELKAIEKFEKKIADKKSVPQVLPEAKVSRQEPEQTQEVAQQDDVAIPVVAPTEETTATNEDTQGDAFEKDRAELAQKSTEEKQALLARLKSLNQAAEEKARADQAAKDAQAGAIAAPARPAEGEAVKGIEEFKQQAGNPMPAYDQDDRLKSRQGTVVYQAYVTKEGRAQDFEMIESSGHRSLDGKTLKAIKQWKFEPGQEGWVEIPFRWDLKGGPQELPGSLRKKLEAKVQ